jgi:Tfp pilus assembly protein PilF
MLGNALRHHQAGRLAQAERIYRQILAIDFQHADSLHLLGMIELQAGRHEAAGEMIRQAIAIDDRQAAYHSNLGTVLQGQGKLDEATARYRQALALQPELAEVYSNLGNILQAQGKVDEAVACQERALALKPDLAEAHFNLGNILQDQDKLDEAAACYERAVAHKPGYAVAHHSLGRTLRHLGNVDQALVEYRRALAVQPDYAQARLSQALAQLLQGDFGAGWRNFESRWQSPDQVTPMRAYWQPLWSGEKLAAGRVLIWGEQGIGDEIMFAGLIPDAVRTGNRCALDCDARLKPLFARSFPGVDVVSGLDPMLDPELEIAAHLPSASLPGLFRTNSAAFAATASPYLATDVMERERFRARYADGRRLAGLAWYTNNRQTGRQRSIDLPLLAPLFERSDIRWISLQYGDRDALEQLTAATQAPVLIDCDVDQLADIDRFAAQIAALDMVITIDNSTAHIAGALGVPVWVMLPFAPDWRWLLERADSPWYPTMRLIRQPRRGDWQSVVQTVQKALG